MYGPSDSDPILGQATPSANAVGNAASEPSAPPAPPSGRGVRPLNYLLCDGKWVHKTSICRLLLNHDFSPKSHNQLMWVRGFTLVNKHVDYTGSSSSSNDELSFIVGNPFITLIRLNDHTTSLALTHSTGIHENGTSHNDIKVKTLQVNGSKVKISGNILLLVPSQSNDLTIWNLRHP
jgi:hypothetical protein